MEDFLKGRPVLDPKSALVVAADTKIPGASIKPPGAAASGATAGSPFADLRPAAAAAAQPMPSGKPGAPAPALQAAAPNAQTLKGEHGTKVQTIVERGRVTKIIVTCTCGKVTEIACDY